MDKPTHTPSDLGITAAVDAVIAAMRADPGYAWTWHCNIAMAFVDEGGDHALADHAAARFMRLLANVEPAHELPPNSTPTHDQLIQAHAAGLAQGRSEAPVAAPIIVGALFDFGGFLTTREQSMAVGSKELASPMADAIKEFAEKRGLSIDDAAVREWCELISK
jgi:hypothetical protein